MAQCSVIWATHHVFLFIENPAGLWSELVFSMTCVIEGYDDQASRSWMFDCGPGAPEMVRRSMVFDLTLINRSMHLSGYLHPH